MIKGRKVAHDGTEAMLKPYMTLENIEIQNELSLEENMKEIREMEAVNMKIDNSIEEN
ncbi:12439_t:CDS:1, partial [Rhizophagus irregularis]